MWDGVKCVHSSVSDLAKEGLGGVLGVGKPSFTRATSKHCDAPRRQVDLANAMIGTIRNIQATD